MIPSFFAAFPRTCQAQNNLADVIDRCEKSVVRIEVVRIEVKGLKGESLGSGFVVESGGLLVTNVHVLAGADQAEAFFADGNSALMLLWRTELFLYTSSSSNSSFR